MSNEKHETVTDIVAKMRREADYIVASAEASVRDGETMAGTPYSSADFDAALDRAMTIRSEADRLEAALKRELATTKESLVVGNAAKLREALESIGNNLERRLFARYPSSATDEWMWQKAKEALAAKPRNCDVGTADEQYQRFLKYCKKNTGGCDRADRYANPCAYCFSQWAQMPYEKGGAK